MIVAVNVFGLLDTVFCRRRAWHPLPRDHDADRSPSNEPKRASSCSTTRARPRTHAEPKPSKIMLTKTEAAMKFIVIDKEKGPIKGVVICLTSPSGTKYYTEETDAEGYAEVLVPVGQKYDAHVLSLGREDIAATVTVTNEPKQNIKLTLRYKRPPPAAFVLNGVKFDTGRGNLVPSPPQAGRGGGVHDAPEERAVEISGHTDNVGNAKVNKTLSRETREACRSYLISKGIEGSRITAVGGEKPTRPEWRQIRTRRRIRQKSRVVELPPE